MKKKTKVAKNPSILFNPKWYEWTNNNLPNRNLMICDIDSCVRSFTGIGNCIALVEIKTGKSKMSPGQSNTYNIIASALKYVSDNNILLNEYLAYPMKVLNFHGVFEIRFENTWFDDSEVYLDGLLSSEEEIINELSFGAMCKICFPNCPECCPNQ